MLKLIRSIFIFVAVGLLAIVGSSCSRKARGARQLAKADRDYSAGQYDQAEIEYLNVLQLQGLNPQAVSHLGIIYFDQGRVERSVAFLLKGRELQPDNLEARFRLGTLYLANGQFKEARDEANYILSRKPQDESAPQLLAEAATQPKDIEDARKRLLSLPPPAPDSAPVLVALGTLDFRQRHVKEAEAALQRAQSLDPKLSAAHSELGMLYRARNNLPKADAELKKAAELSPPRSFRRLQYAQFKIQNGEVGAAKRLLEEMTKNTPDYLPAWKRLAELAMTDKKYDEGEALIAKALARDSTNLEALLIEGRLRLAKGEVDKALVAFERAQGLHPRAALACYELGQAYIVKGDITKAANSLNRAVTLAPNYADAILLLADLNIRRGSYGPAVAALKQLVQQRPQLIQAPLLLADAYRAQGNLDDALTVYRQVEEHFPRYPQTPLMRGLVLLQQNKLDEARNAFDTALKLTPDSLLAVEQLVNIDLLEQKYAAARQRAEDKIAKDPKRAEPQLLLAKVFLAQQDLNQAETAVKKAIELQPDSPTPYLLLAQLYVGTNQKDKALANLNQLVAKNPKNAGALVLIGAIQEQQKDYAAARDAYEKVLAVNPKFGPALNNLAYLYSEHFNQLDKARDLAQQAREVTPQDPYTADTLGWILSRQRQYPWALTLLQESAEKLPTDAEVQFHLGMTHYLMGEEEPARLALQRALEINKDVPGSDEARRCLAILDVDAKAAGPEVRASLEKTVAQRPDDPIALGRLATVYARSGALDKAIGTYETVLRANPTNAAATLGLAKLYAGRGDTAKALDMARNARKLSPDDPAVAHELGRLAFQMGDHPWATSLLEEAARKQPDQPDVLFDYAQAAYSVGRVSDAETAMNQAVQANAAFPRIDEAKRFLELLAMSANPSEAATAMSKVEQALKSDPTNVPALMVTAAVAEQKPDVAAAKQTYEKILARYPGFSPAQKRLAILYSSNPADNQKALDIATKARQAFPDDAELAKAFGIIEYRQGDYARAVSLLQESAGKRSEDAELMYYLGMARYRTNKRAESKQALQRALDLGLSGDPAAEARRTLAEK
jgi:tetratricopeptide (TPR) repeat protein